MTIVAAALLALGFLGLAHALIEGLVGEPRPRRWRAGPQRAPDRAADRRVQRRHARASRSLACLLPGSEPVELFMRGVA